MEKINQLTSYVFLPFKQWKDYKSKTKVTDFWLGMLSATVIFYLLMYGFMQLQTNASETMKVVLGGVGAIFLVYYVIAIYALQARRLNDRKSSKWWLIVVPIVNVLAVAIIVAVSSLSALAFLVKFGVGIYYLYLLSTKSNN